MDAPPAERLALRYERVADADIAVWTAGDDDADPLVLVHGSGATRVWWTPMLPHLVRSRKVVLVELSGHGLSDHRPGYSFELWAAEVAAVIRSLGRPVTLAGHSMGGTVTALCAVTIPHLVRHLVLFDAMPRRADEGEIRWTPPNPSQYFDSRDELADRFRFRPAQPHPPDDVMAQVLDSMVVRTPQGWTWRNDTSIRADYRDPILDGLVARLRCPTTWVLSQSSRRLHRDLVDRIGAESLVDYRMVSIPGTHHHLMFEAPETCAAMVPEHT
jgi:pimeloyl-ACP methyl ester carboxylesterase